MLNGIIFRDKLQNQQEINTIFDITADAVSLIQNMKSQEVGYFERFYVQNIS
jgi:hypothetical protein